MRGRKPTQILAGSAVVAATLAAPSWLSRDARAEWQRVLPILVARKTLTEADLPTLENYCTAVGAVREAQRVINRQGIIIETQKGPKRNPAFGIQNAAITTARLCAAELGLTPISRSRPALVDSNNNFEDNPLDM